MSVAVKITSSRQFRKGRVLHNGSTDAVLVSSPSPRRWNVILVNRSTLAAYRTTSSEALRRDYTFFSSGSVNPLPTSRADAVYEEASRYFGASAMPPLWTIRAALTRKTLLPGTAKSTLSASAAAAEPKTEGTKAETVREPEVMGRRESVFSIPALPEKPYWYESDNDRKLLRDFISLREAGFTVNLMISGPSGAGKTVGVQRLGEELGIPVHLINCQAITTPEKWLGQMMADPEKGTHFVPSQHIQWVERTHEDCVGADRCILLYDEITRLRPELNNMTYSLFDTQRGLEVPQMGRRVLMAKENLVISTANIGAAFAGTFGQDRAFRERFSMTMERDFPPADEEVKVLTSATGIREDQAASLVKVAVASRLRWKEQSIEQPISTRTLVTWALLVAGGYDIMQAAEYTVLPLYSEDGGVESDRAKIRLLIEGKVA